MKFGLWRNIAYGVVLTIVCSCTTRAYLGPSRGAEDIAIIEIHADPAVSITRLIVNDLAQPVFADKVEVLPGQQRVSLKYTVTPERCEQPDYNCPFDYPRGGTCEATLNTKAGRNYLLTLSKNASLIDISISAKGYFDFFERDDEPNAGFGHCR